MSPTSTEEKIRTLYDDVSAAVDEGLLADATSRNALYKIHVSLGKIVNSLGEGDKMSRRSRSVSVANSVGTMAGTTSVATGDRSVATDEDENVTVVLARRDGDATVLEDVAEEEEVEEEEQQADTVKVEEDGDGETVLKRDGEDELVEELLSDDDDDDDA